MSSLVFAGSSDGYDRFMGRYSQQLAAPFIDFAHADGHVLDVGAGTGALTKELVARGFQVAAAEPSDDFVETLRERFPAVEVCHTPAESLPWPDGTFDAVLSQLVVAFLPDAVAAMQEQRRVLRPGGIAAACMWELDGIEVMGVLNEVRKRMQPDADGTRIERWRSETELYELFEQAGFDDALTTTIEVSVPYASVDELWHSAIESAGPGGSPGANMPAPAVAAGRDVAADVLGNPEGPFTLHARCACVRGVRAA
jgi:SAM-dependent methyltransferase